MELQCFLCLVDLVVFVVMELLRAVVLVVRLLKVLVAVSLCPSMVVYVDSLCRLVYKEILGRE